jgi:hypothetical protein
MQLIFLYPWEYPDLSEGQLQLQLENIVIFGENDFLLSCKRSLFPCDIWYFALGSG